MALPAGNRAIGAAFDLRRRIAPYKKAQLCRSAAEKPRKDSGRVFLYPDSAARGGVVRVSKGGFFGTAFRI